MAKSLSYRHYLKGLELWPRDTLRPDVSFQKALHRRVEKRFSEPSGSHNSTAIGGGAPSNTPALTALGERAELEQVNVLYSFLENRYEKKYPLSEHLLRPKSNPIYYENLMKELEEAPRRSWFARMTNSWKGFLRYK